MNIVEFNSSNEVRIDGLYALAIQIKAQCGNEYKTLAFVANDDSEQITHFEDATLIGYFKDYSLYLIRSSEDIGIIEMDVVPLSNALKVNPSPQVEYTVVDNELVPLAVGDPTTTGIGVGEIITASIISNIVTEVNNEAKRRDGTGAVNSRANAVLAGDAIKLQGMGGAYSNLAAPLAEITDVVYPKQGDVILATGDGTYQYLYDLAESLSTISDTATSTGCNASCTGLCRTGCYSGCTNACTGNCGGNCTGSCSGTCSGTCRGSCTGGCSSSCNGGYRGGCSDCTYGVESGDCC